MMERKAGWILAAVWLVGIVGLMGCARLTVVPVAGASYRGTPLTAQELCQDPFGHGRRKADFDAQLPRTKVTRMVSRSEQEPGRADTIFSYDFPDRGGIRLYQTSFGQELFLTAVIKTNKFPLRNGLRVGLPLDSVRRYVELPGVVGDTLKIAEPGCPHNLSLHFGADQRLRSILIWATRR